MTKRLVTSCDISFCLEKSLSDIADHSTKYQGAGIWFKRLYLHTVNGRRGIKAAIDTEWLCEAVIRHRCV